MELQSQFDLMKTRAWFNLLIQVGLFTVAFGMFAIVFGRLKGMFDSLLEALLYLSENDIDIAKAQGEGFLNVLEGKGYSGGESKDDGHKFSEPGTIRLPQGMTIVTFPSVQQHQQLQNQQPTMEMAGQSDTKRLLNDWAFSNRESPANMLLNKNTLSEKELRLPTSKRISKSDKSLHLRPEDADEEEAQYQKNKLLYLEHEVPEKVKMLKASAKRSRIYHALKLASLVLLILLINILGVWLNLVDYSMVQTNVNSLSRIVALERGIGYLIAAIFLNYQGDSIQNTRDLVSTNIRKVEEESKYATDPLLQPYKNLLDLTYFNNFCQSDTTLCNIHPVMHSGLNVILEGIIAFSKENVTQVDWENAPTREVIAKGAMKGLQSLRLTISDGLNNILIRNKSVDITLGVTHISLVGVIAVALIIVYTHQLSFLHRRILLLLRFFSDSSLRRNRITSYILHKNKIITW